MDRNDDFYRSATDGGNDGPHKSTTVAFRVGPELENKLEHFQHEHNLTRSGAARELLERGLIQSRFLEQIQEVRALREQTYELMREMDHEHQEKWEEVLDELLL